MVRVVERVAGGYDVREVEFGRVYRWRPESVVVECECGEKPTLTSSMTICECGVDHVTVVREELPSRRQEDEVAHPWRYAGDREGVGIPY